MIRREEQGPGHMASGLVADNTDTSTIEVAGQKNHQEGSNESETRKIAEDQDVEVQRTPTNSSEPVYSAFTRREKIFIAVMASLGSFFSPFTGSVYLPAINTLADHYHTSVSNINLSVTTYMILQGTAPMFTGDFGDRFGRRPAIVLCFVIYLGANIGLGVQNSYAALLAVRCLQSAGSSGTVALARGVIADVVTPAERGSYLGFTMAGVSLAPAIAPIIGGALADSLGWRSIFWFLTIFTACFLLPYICFMPETNRKIVGDGSIRPTKWYHVSLMDVLRSRQESNETAASTQNALPKSKVKWYSLGGPWRTIKLFGEFDIILISIANAFNFGALYCLLTSNPAIFGSLYGFDDFKVGLCYLPLGAGCSVAGFVNGKLLDWNWRRTAKKNNLPYDRKRAPDLRNFPVEKARLQTLFPTLAPGLLALLPYGWALQYGAPLPVPLILQFFCGYSLTSASNTTQNLTVDLFPGMAATVSANNNLSRCLFGAGCAAVIKPMLDNMGWGWCFTFITIICATQFPLMWFEIRCGPKWREERRQREERKQKDKQAKKELKK
ncbi:putative MFS transporter [Rhizodiscina lignyota]|uniref:MFS transporter n=1 Tax=Rhizodiscina lignyota TaxID=1504668 RepID=A0A9P4IAZ1_9PEZI|nr:putative MFS transporter [Rhizodiscina lignyota]